LADEIKEAVDLEPELIGGQGGVFDVELDGVKIFSKHELHRFPAPNEIVDLIRDQAG